MRVLIGGSPSKIFHLQEFQNSLIKLGIKSSWNIIARQFIENLIENRLVEKNEYEK